MLIYLLRPTDQFAICIFLILLVSFFELIRTCSRNNFHNFVITKQYFGDDNISAYIDHGNTKAYPDTGNTFHDQIY